MPSRDLDDFVMGVTDDPQVALMGRVLGHPRLDLLGICTEGPRPLIKPAPPATDATPAISSPTTAVAPQADSPASESSNRSAPPEDEKF
jgi:hypothetical protein